MEFVRSYIWIVHNSSVKSQTKKSSRIGVALPLNFPYVFGLLGTQKFGVLGAHPCHGTWRRANGFHGRFQCHSYLSVIGLSNSGSVPGVGFCNSPCLGGHLKVLHRQRRSTTKKQMSPTAVLAHLWIPWMFPAFKVSPCCFLQLTQVEPMFQGSMQAVVHPLSCVPQCHNEVRSLHLVWNKQVPKKTAVWNLFFDELLAIKQSWPGHRHCW